MKFQDLINKPGDFTDITWEQGNNYITVYHYISGKVILVDLPSFVVTMLGSIRYKAQKELRNSIRDLLGL